MNTSLTCVLLVLHSWTVRTLSCRSLLLLLVTAELISDQFKEYFSMCFKCVDQLLSSQSRPPPCSQTNNQPPTCFPWCSCEMRTTWAASPHVAPLTVPALVALIRRGVPGRSLWRHRLTALLALLQPGPACTPASPLIPPKGPGACGEVGHWRWSWIAAWLGSVHLCC